MAMWIGSPEVPTVIELIQSSRGVLPGRLHALSPSSLSCLLICTRRGTLANSVCSLYTRQLVGIIGYAGLTQRLLLKFATTGLLKD